MDWHIATNSIYRYTVYSGTYSYCRTGLNCEVKIFVVHEGVSQLLRGVKVTINRTCNLKSKYGIAPNFHETIFSVNEWRSIEIENLWACQIITSCTCAVQCIAPFCSSRETDHKVCYSCCHNSFTICMCNSRCAWPLIHEVIHEINFYHKTWIQAVLNHENLDPLKFGAIRYCGTYRNVNSQPIDILTI